VVLHVVVLRRFDSINSHTNTALARSMATMAAQHKLLAPIYTQHLQPVGTPAKDASWDGETVWPQWTDVATLVKDLVIAADQLSLDEIHAWYNPLAEAYADKGVAVSIAELQKVMAPAPPPPPPPPHMLGKPDTASGQV